MSAEGNGSMNRKQRRVRSKTGSVADAEVGRLFDEAMRFFRSGALDLAADRLRQAIGRAPAIPELHNNLGSALKELGRWEEAIAAYRNALQLEPNLETALSNLSSCLFITGNLSDAESVSRQTIETYPNNVIALSNLAMIAQKNGDLESSINFYRSALQFEPTLECALINLPNCLFATGKFAEAEAVARQALASFPGNEAVLLNLGKLLNETGRPQEAIEICRLGIGRAPKAIALFTYLTQLLMSAKRFEEALETCLRRLELAPAEVLGLNDLARIYSALNRQEDAIRMLQYSIQLHPEFPTNYTLLGSALANLGKCDEAISAGQRAVELAPNDALTLGDVGKILCDCNMVEDGYAYYQRALAINPDLPALRTNIGLMALKLGDFATGWREVEWRWACQGVTRDRWNRPEWQGENLAGRTILLYGEQGHGDVIQFLRYVPLLAAQGARVIVVVHSGLVRLASTMAGVAEALPLDASFPPFDLHLPLMSLPRVLATTLETIPSEVPYLQPAPSDKGRFADALSKCSGLKVGLVWAGDSNSSKGMVGPHRDLPPHFLEPLLGIPGIDFVSLQMDGASALAEFPDERRPLNLMSGIRDFADTAALVAELDLVLAVDTAVAHLAGALGKPVWLFQRLNSDWRWLTGRNDSPWYPTLHIYQQTHLGDWAPVISAVKADLEALARNTPSRQAPSSPLQISESQGHLIRATRIAIQAAIAQSANVASYLEAPVEGVPDVAAKLQAFCQNRQSITDYEYRPTWRDDLNRLLDPSRLPDLIRIAKCQDPLEVALEVIKTYPNLYRPFLADGALLLLRKDTLFDFCSSLFVETGSPTIFEGFIRDVVGISP